DRYVILVRVEPRDGIQVAPEVDADWTDWRGIAQPNSHGVCVIVDEVVEVDCAIDVATIVEHYAAERFYYAQGKACLRVQNDKLLAANRYRNVDTSRLTFQDITKWHQTLGTSLINRKAAQGRAAARKEQLAGRDKASGEWSRQPQTDAVRKHQGMDRLVVCVLGKELGEVRARTECGRSDPKVDGGIGSSMCVERLVAGIVNQRCRERREPYVSVLFKHKFRNQKV